VRWLFILFLLIRWVIWNNKPINQSINKPMRTQSTLGKGFSTCGPQKDFWWTTAWNNRNWVHLARWTLLKTKVALELQTSWYARFRHCALEIVVTLKFDVAKHTVHNIQLLKLFWDREAALVAMKTKSTSRLNVENDLIYALSCVGHRISMLSNNEQTQPSHWL